MTDQEEEKCFEIDPRIKSYGKFTDQTLHTQLRIAAQPTILYEPVVRLLSAWEALSSIRSMPPTLSDVMAKQHYDYGQALLHNTTRASRAFAKDAFRRMKADGLGITTTQEIQFSKILDSHIVQEMDMETLEQCEVSIWNGMLEMNAIRGVLFYSQRMVLANMFSFYEIFIQDILFLNPTKNQQDKDKVKDKMNLLCEELGVDKSAKSNFYNQDIVDVKFLRDSILHNGCTCTAQLKSAVNSKRLHLHSDGTIFVMPELVDAVYRGLLAGAIWIVQTAIKSGKYNSPTSQVNGA